MSTERVIEQRNHKTCRRHCTQLKQQILAECAQPDASVASVALSHGINANVVHKWRRLDHGPSRDLQVPAFVPVALPAPSYSLAPDIRIELRRYATSVPLIWPVAAAEHCASPTKVARVFSKYARGEPMLTASCGHG